MFLVAPRKKHISRENPLASEATNVVTGVVIAMVRLPTLPPWVYKESSIDWSNGQIFETMRW